MARDQADAARARLVEALERTAAGDRAAFRRVHDMTAAKLFGVCLRISQDRAIAEDIVQDVYLKIWHRAGRYDSARASPITWLCAIARNTAIDWRRAARGPVMVTDDDAAVAIPDDRPLAPHVIEAEEERVRVLDCLDRLEVKAQGAIRTAFFDGVTYAELAARAAVPLGTMKSWVRRGLLQLRSCIDD